MSASASSADVSCIGLVGTVDDGIHAPHEGLSWFDRSLELWQRMKEPGVVNPAGYNVTPRDEVIKRRAQLRAEITAAGLATKPRS